MINTVIFDIDKVLITNPNIKEYSEIFSKKYSVEKDLFLKFINSDYKQAKIGKADLEKQLSEKLSTWGVKISAQNILNEWYTPKELIINTELRNKLNKNPHYKYYIASNNERYRGEILWNQLRLKDYFQDKFFSYEIGYTKSDPKFFEIVCEKLHADPKNLLFVDDKVKNIESANNVGILTILYINNEELFKSLQKFLPEFK